MVKLTKEEQKINEIVDGLKISSFVYNVRTDTTTILYEVVYNRKLRSGWSKYNGRPEMTGRKLSTTKNLKDFMKSKGGIGE